MKDLFYIVKIGDWYRLHIKDTHYCIGGCENLSPLLNTVRRLIKKYRTKARLISALSSLEDKGLVNEKMTEVYQQDYELYSDECDEVLAEVIEKALTEVKEDTPFKRAQKRLNKVRSKKTENTGISSDLSPLGRSENEVKRPVERKRPTLLKRTIHITH